MDDARERRCLIALHLVPGLGAVRIARLIGTLGSAAAVWDASGQALTRVPGIGPRLAAFIERGRGAVNVERELRRATDRGARVLTWLDAGYPARLRALHDAPPVLYVRGAWSGGSGPGVAIVGTRRASAYGLSIARHLGEVLAGAGAVVISGLARGIDRAAHVGALRVGGITVGVLGCGVDVAYPPEHRALIEGMQRTGAVVAELPMGTPPRPQQFPPRNRLVSGLAQAVVVVEGDVDSGAVITARYAVAQGRPVFAVPGSVYARQSRGPHRLLAGGAGILDAPETLLEFLGLPRTPQVGTDAGPANAAGIGAKETRTLGVLNEQGMHIDAIAARAGLGAAETAAVLAALEVRGLVRRLPGMHYARQTARWPGGEAPGTAQENAGGATWPDHSSS